MKYDNIKFTNTSEARSYIEQHKAMKKYHKVQRVKNFFKSLIKKIIWLVVVLGLIAGVVQYFRWSYPTIVTKEVTKEVIINQTIDYPVLKRIAQCESGNTHYDKNGQVLLRGNTNKTVDVGKYQINSIWFKKASELGLDLTREKDNEEFAKYLYTTRGTVDWIYSQKCWNK